MLLIRWFIVICIAFILGKIVSKFRLPSLLGWLLVGMILGPYGFALLSNDLVGSHWYEVILKILECAVGFMIGTELVIKKLKKSGKALVVTTIFQSLGTYFFVSLMLFYYNIIYVYCANIKAAQKQFVPALFSSSIIQIINPEQ